MGGGTVHLVAAVLLWLASAHASEGSEHPAERLVRSTTTEVLRALDDDPAIRESTPRLIGLVSRLVVPHFDFKSMSRRVLGRGWRAAAPGQRDAFVREFRTLLVRTYGILLSHYSGQDVRFEVPRVRPDGRRVTVPTAILVAGQPVTLSYAMRRLAGVWKVYDVSVDGVSLVVTYRSTFGAALRSDGLDALIERLRQKNRDPLN